MRIILLISPVALFVYSIGPNVRPKAQEKIIVASWAALPIVPATSATLEKGYVPEDVLPTAFLPVNLVLYGKKPIRAFAPHIISHRPP